ncbi:GHMP kinase [Geminicoccaceae bacterium 1502E]|nr:GHMP kinase [Geminicoccaceae bacterium 1502E]
MPESQAPRVRVLAPARLHLGFLDMHGGLGRRFGSIGLALEGLGTRLLARSDASTVTGPDAERARRARDLVCDAWGLPPAGIEIDEVIPRHAGLGSGTQLGLAVGAAIATLHGRPVDAAAIALLLERGARSGIGVGTFAAGGFLLDGGKGASEVPPPMIARLAFPDSWRMILVLDDNREGLSGSAEAEAFATLARFPEQEAARLCRIALMQLLPAVAEADLEAAGRALGEIQRSVGDHFAPAQGGRFTSSRVAEVLAWCETQGLAGVGQSSWGPTGFALVGNPDQADALARQARRRFEQLRIEVAAARNRPALVALEA